MITCDHCKTQNENEAVYCRHCGKSLGIVCPNPSCRKPNLSKETLYCPDCGTKIDSNFIKRSPKRRRFILLGGILAALVSSGMILFFVFIYPHLRGVLEKEVEKEARQFAVKNYPIETVLIKGGTFMMGDDNHKSSKPEHKVRLSTFYMSKTEVTQSQWYAIMEYNPSGNTGVNFPVEGVSWDEIQVFIKKLNQLTGKHYRLPTEAEWEYAAGGGSSSRTSFSGTDVTGNLTIYSWIRANSDDQTHPVGLKRPNTLGLYDMTGNVEEWCEDYYKEGYWDFWTENFDAEPYNNPNYQVTGDERVIRGGSHLSDDNWNVAQRGSMSSNSKSDLVGFRLILVP